MNRKKPIDIPSCTGCDHKTKDSLFCGLGQLELESISLNKTSRNFKKGTIIFSEGNHANGLYCIYEGKVKIHKLGNEGREQIVRFASVGDVLGYRALLGDETYNATATALEDCAICYIPRTDFMHSLEKNPELSFKTMRLLTNDLRMSEERIVRITQKPVIERISEALVILNNKFGTDNDGHTLNISVSRREIGELSCLTTETTIRALSSLNKQGVITLRGKHICLNDLSQLIRLANIYD